MTERGKWFWLAIVTVAATSFGVFVLPFFIPPAPLDVVSAALSAGFNNRVAALAAAAISGCVLIIAIELNLRIRMPREQDCQRMSRRFLWGWSFALALAILALGYVEYLSREPYMNDYRYFVVQMRKIADYHRMLYAQVELPYGPLLIYPPIWIRGLFRFCEEPLLAAHLAILFVYEVSGCLLLGYVLNRLPIATRLRCGIFVWAVLYMLVPNLGLAYTYVRFVFPMASLIFCIRRREPLLIGGLFLLAEMVSLGLSPEMGFAFACGAGVFALAQLFLQRRWVWLTVALAPLPGAALFLMIAGPEYLQMLRQFSGGAFNFIVEPQPYVLIFLMAVVWLIPLLLATSWRSQRQDAAMLSAVFVSGIALLPVAFGRADPGHVGYDGLALLLLAAIPVSARGAWSKRFCMAALCLMLLTLQLTTWAMNRYFVEGVVKLAMVERLPASIRRSLANSRLPISARTKAELTGAVPYGEAPDVFARIRAVTGDAVIATPAPISEALERALRRHNMYLPDYYAYGVATISAASERRENAIMNAATWMVLPSWGLIWTSETPENTQEILGLSLPYRQRRPPFLSGQLMKANLENNWRPVANVDGYTVYRRRW